MGQLYELALYLIIDGRRILLASAPFLVEGDPNGAGTLRIPREMIKAFEAEIEASYREN